MDLLRIPTARLELVLATADLFRADLEGRHALGEALGARVPRAWPPPLLDDATLRHFIALASDTDGSSLAGFYWILVGDGGRVLVGNGGLVREARDRLMLGYSVLEEYQGRGLATEAVTALVAYGFADPEIERIVAFTYPSFASSRRVLAKTGFTPAGAGPDAGTIAFERRREAGDQTGTFSNTKAKNE
jgi:RimJ/RimL family protein N-acetyltransferase